MNLFRRLTRCCSRRGRAVSLYKRGMAKARKHDHQGALQDYTNTLGMPGTPAELLAMVLFNRALVYVAAGDQPRGAADLDAVLAMNEACANVKLMARQKLARMVSRASKQDA